MFNYKKYLEIRDIIEKRSLLTKIVSISKNHPKESVLDALKSGVTIFGENRVLEAKSKFEELKKTHSDIELHLTGPLQSNKVKQAVSLFDVFHTLDREKIAKEFSKYTDQLKNKKIFIQVNTGEEKSKSGISPKHLKEFKSFCTNDMMLNICGLMCIPPVSEKPDDHFNLLQNLAKENQLNKLSIGMSNDYKLALNFNPHYIRLGTILFGKRALSWNSTFTPI